MEPILLDEEEEDTIRSNEFIPKVVAKKFWQRKSPGEKIVEKFRPLFTSSPRLASFRNKKAHKSASLDAPHVGGKWQKEEIPVNSTNWASFDGTSLVERDADDEESTFFDSLSRQWVKVDNFAFSEGTNHFDRQILELDSNELKDESSGCRKTLDQHEPRMKDEIDEASTDSSVMSRLDPNVIKENQFQMSLSDANKIEEAFIYQVNSKHMPKIVDSPREGKALNKLSDSPCVIQTKMEEATDKSAKLKSTFPRFNKKGNNNSSTNCNSNNNCPVMKRRFNKLEENHEKVTVRSKSSLNFNEKLVTNKIKSLSRSEGHLNKMTFETSLFPLAGHKKEFNHVPSKVKDYIAQVKSLSKSSKDLSVTQKESQNMDNDEEASIRKSVSLSNLSKDSTKIKNDMKRIKSYLDISLQSPQAKLKMSRNKMESLEKFDRTRIARLLDHLSDEDLDEEQLHDEDAFSVEDVLILALEERREKKEAENVLCKLQANYDALQRKYAEAENKIDNLRFRSSSRNGLDESRLENFVDSAFTEPNSSALASFAYVDHFGDERRSKHLPPFRHEETSINSDFLGNKQELDDSSEQLIIEINTAISKLLKHPGMSSDGSQCKENLEELLQAAKEKLHEFNVRNDDIARPKASKEIAGKNSPETREEEEVDPIEKVANWNNFTEPCKRATNSSCYGSLPTSPSPPALANETTKTTTTSSPPAEFDSGYPGSDRSVKFYTLKSATKPDRFLFNVEEELENPKMLDYHSPDDNNKTQTNLLTLPNMHRTYLHSVTDLSSDEKSMTFDQTERSQEFNQSNWTHNNNNHQHRPVISAHQIEQEINQLRNTFEDRREGLMDVLNHYPSNHHKEAKKMESQQKPRKQWSIEDSGTDVADVELERKLEFQKRRKSKKSKSHRKSESEVIQEPEFAIGYGENSLIHNYSPKSFYEQQNISSFFPPLKNTIESIPNGSMNANCRKIETDFGSIFVPRLNLEDAWTDEDKFLDARSFDFLQSLSIQEELDENIIADAVGKSPEVKTITQRQQNVEYHSPAHLAKNSGAIPKHEIDCLDGGSRSLDYTGHCQAENLERSASSKCKPDIQRRSSYSGNTTCPHSLDPIVIVRSCCLHKSSNKVQDGCDSDHVYSKKASTRSSLSMPTLLHSKPNSVRSRKRKSKAKKEMKALLASLEQANMMASNLRQRSRDIVFSLGQELTREEEETFKTEHGEIKI